jgi:arabinose-5-phosphate isomerase
MPTIETAKRVINQEIEGLKSLETALGTEFEKLIDKIHEVTQKNKGRVILSGMGKSGHIGAKIAATLASTGTPAFFVHPAEASHGDMGMITQNDIVLLLSNSGETAELKDITAYCKRFGIYLVGIVRRQTSALVDAADIAIVLPDTPEANGVNAPTTSTTQMLALGDAIAVTLLERVGFEASDFKKFHPGGKLGAQFTLVQDLMHAGGEIPLVSQDAVMKEALLQITSHKFGCVGVVNGSNELVGIVTDGDLRRHIETNFLGLKAGEVMTANPKSIKPRALAAEALNIMNTKQITVLFVLEDKKPIGILHIHDLLRAGV